MIFDACLQAGCLKESRCKEQYMTCIDLHRLPRSYDVGGLSVVRLILSAVR